MTQDSTDGIRLQFTDALTMRTVEPILATLREAIDAASADPAAGIAIDCSGASEIDLTFIQLLIATRLSARRLEAPVSLATGPDRVLLDALTRGGFQVVTETSPSGDRFWFEGSPV